MGYNGFTKKGDKFTHTEEVRAKISANHARYWLGKKRIPSLETRKKRSISMQGKNVGKKRSEETKQKMRKKHKPMLEETKRKIGEYQINNPNRIFKDTKPELRMEALLKSLGVDSQKRMTFKPFCCRISSCFISFSLSLILSG